ncbi:MAG: META domain-containing protein [Wenzhouxiangellaceae bacterium]|nr:META domain-containing protein [Wenzhouxiangellaceae bacterium]
MQLQSLLMLAALAGCSNGTGPGHEPGEAERASADPERIDRLAGRTWVVDRIDGSGVTGGAQIELHFVAADSRVVGTAGCNRFTASYRLTARNLSIGPVAATRKTCQETVMRQERRFIDALENTTDFDIDATGVLVLHGPAGRIRAKASRAGMPPP